MAGVTLAPESVTAVVVTRGDVPLEEVLASLIFRDVIVWDNSKLETDWGAFGRYAAVHSFGTAPVIYVQDDDCVVKPADQLRLLEAYEAGVLTALMPAERVDYKDTVLVGWGALFDRHLPAAAFRRWQGAGTGAEDEEFRVVGCDFVFPMLTRWRRLDAHHRDLPHAHADNRTWATYPDYANVKERILREARAVRDAPSSRTCPECGGGFAWVVTDGRHAGPSCTTLNCPRAFP